MPTTGSEASWAYSLNQAVTQHLIFGRDIIFSFGPYASVYTHLYCPSTVWIMVLGSLILSAFCIVCFARLAWDARLQWPSVLVCIVVVLAVRPPILDPFFFSIPFLVCLVLFKLQSSSHEEAFANKFTLILVLLAFACLGPLPLIKGTLLPLTAGASLACAAFLLANNRPILALACPSVTGLAMVASWLAALQPLRALPGYLLSMKPIISGYSEAMSTDGHSWMLILFVAGAAVVLLSIAVKRELSIIQKGFLLLVFSLYLFVAFKEGFVRADDHAMVAMNCLAFSSLFLFLLNRDATHSFNSRRLLAVALLASMLTILASWRNTFYAGEDR